MPSLPERVDNGSRIIWAIEYKPGCDMSGADLHALVERRLTDRAPEIDWLQSAGCHGMVYRGRVFSLQSFKDTAPNLSGRYPPPFFKA